MDKTKLIKTLSELAQLDVDAIGAYEIAIEKIDDQDIKQALDLFKEDHERHVEDLNKEINQLGGEIVQKQPDLKGLLIEGMTLLRSAMGTESALKAMRSNEETTNQTYDEALSDNSFPPHIQSLIRKNRDDERKHLAYIEEQLDIFEKEK